MNWISLHIFHNYSFEKVLNEHIFPLTNYLKEKKYIRSMFFIRYWEGGPHIRYRVLPLANTDISLLKNIIFNKSKKYFSELKKENLKYSFEFIDYIKEKTRYGGGKLINVAEEHFQDSSNTILKLLNSNFLNWNYSTAISFAIQMHTVFAKKLNADIDKSIIFFELYYKHWLFYSVKLNKDGEATQEQVDKVKVFFKESYKKQETTTNYIVKAIWEELESIEWLGKWSKSCSKIKSLLMQVNEEDIELLNSPYIHENSNLSIRDQKLFSIFDSYIHMTNNRLGIHLRDEAFIAYIIMNGLKKHFVLQSVQKH